MSRNNSVAPPPLPGAAITARVRYGETDQMGVVYHANYFVYFEMGRTEYLRRAGAAYAELEKQGTYMVVVEVGAEYKSPASYDDELSIATTLTSMSHARIRFDYEIKKVRDQSRLATGFTVLACVDRNGRVMRIPEPLSRALMKGKMSASPSTRIEPRKERSAVRGSAGR